MRVPFSVRLGPPAAENALAVLKAERLAAGLPILDFSESNPTRVFSGKAGDSTSGTESLALLSSLSDPANLGYDPDPRGLIRAREALTRFYEDAGRAELGSSGPIPGPERLFLCASTSEAYGWLFKLLCDPGDAVLVPKPGYPLFDYLAGLEAVEARPYRLEYLHPSGWRIDLDSMKSAIAKGSVRAVVLINPNNPTGSYISRREREAILSLCSQSGAALIVDEVFFGFPVEAGERRSFVGEERALTFVLGGLSKLLGLPQMKLGWIAASGPAGELAEALGRLEIIADTYLSAGAPVMNALPDLLRGATSFASSMGARLAANLAALRAALEAQPSAQPSAPQSPHRVLRCAGGWTAIIESPRLLPEENLALGLLREEGLASHPGYFFDMEREAFFTASLILPPELLEEGARRYRAYFARLIG